NSSYGMLALDQASRLTIALLKRAELNRLGHQLSIAAGLDVEGFRRRLAIEVFAILDHIGPVLIAHGNGANGIGSESGRGNTGTGNYERGEKGFELHGWVPFFGARAGLVTTASRALFPTLQHMGT